MIDIFDIIAFAVFAVLLVAAVVIVVTLGSLPGQIAHKGTVLIRTLNISN